MRPRFGWVARRFRCALPPLPHSPANCTSCAWRRRRPISRPPIPNRPGMSRACKVGGWVVSRGRRRRPRSLVGNACPTLTLLPPTPVFSPARCADLQTTADAARADADAARAAAAKVEADLASLAAAYASLQAHASSLEDRIASLGAPAGPAGALRRVKYWGRAARLGVRPRPAHAPPPSSSRPRRRRAPHRGSCRRGDRGRRGRRQRPVGLFGPGAVEETRGGASRPRHLARARSRTTSPPPPTPGGAQGGAPDR